MTDARLFQYTSFGLLFGIFLSCTTRPDPRSESEDAEVKFGTGPRFLRVFLKYCGSDVLPDEQLSQAQLCSYRQKLVSLRPFHDRKVKLLSSEPDDG